MVEEERWGSALPRAPVCREHFARTQDAWRARVKASESLQSSREPGPGWSVWNRRAAERDRSSDFHVQRPDGLFLGWSSFHSAETLREDLCRHERGQERLLSLIRFQLYSLVAPVWPV